MKQIYKLKEKVLQNQMLHMIKAANINFKSNVTYLKVCYDCDVRLARINLYFNIVLSIDYY